MLFELYEDIVTKVGKPLTWVVSGTYPVLRFFSKNKLLIDTGKNGVRQLTVVNVSKGKLYKNAQS